MRYRNAHKHDGINDEFRSKFGSTCLWLGFAADFRWAPHMEAKGPKRVAPKDLSVETLQLRIQRCCRRIGTTNLYEWPAMAALQVTWKTAPQAQA